MALVTLEAIKQQCRIEPEFTDEDSYLDTLTQAAISLVENTINKTLIADDATPVDGQQPVTPSIRMAVMLLVGHWYTNREAVVTGTIATTVPLAFASLLAPYCEQPVG